MNQNHQPLTHILSQPLTHITLNLQATSHISLKHKPSLPNCKPLILQATSHIILNHKHSLPNCKHLNLQATSHISLKQLSILKHTNLQTWFHSQTSLNLSQPLSTSLNLHYTYTTWNLVSLTTYSQPLILHYTYPTWNPLNLPLKLIQQPFTFCT